MILALNFRTLQINASYSADFLWLNPVVDNYQIKCQIGTSSVDSQRVGVQSNWIDHR